MSKLPRSFYDRPNVVQVARDLLGKVLVTDLREGTTAAIITETEAYAGEFDRASHAHGGKITKRNAVMYGPPGFAYVYLCYGIHHLFNIVTNAEGIAHAVLVRAVEPLEGMGIMARRRGMAIPTTGGPGILSQALGITTAMTGFDLLGSTISIEDRGILVPDTSIIEGPRIGVDYAGEDALLPYRFRTSKQPTT